MEKNISSCLINLMIRMVGRVISRSNITGSTRVIKRIGRKMKMKGEQGVNAARKKRKVNNCNNACYIDGMQGGN